MNITNTKAAWHKSNQQHGFTLIELLIVVAILGILASVAVVQYQGYQENAKITSSKENHQNVINVITGSFLKCSAGATTIPLNGSSTSCAATITTFANDFETYFDSISLNNPHNPGTNAIVVGAASTNLGSTYLTTTSTSIIVTTPISSSSTLTDTVLKE